MLVAFEGIDGCGKSTQALRFAEWARTQLAPRPVHHHREPGGTDLGERIRELLLHGSGMEPEAEMLLYMASRSALYAEHVLPALERDEVVVLDRSYYSTVAYQGAGLDLGEELILRLSRLVTQEREFDRVVLLSIDVAEAAQRLAVGPGSGDRIETRGRTYFEKVADAYRRFAAAEPHRFIVLDGGGPEDEVAERVKEVLRDVIGN